MNTIFKVLLISLVIVSCNKNMPDNSGSIIKSTQTNTVTTKRLASEVSATPSGIYSSISYFASTRTFIISTDIDWSGYIPSSSDLTNYSIRYRISGHQPNPESVEMPITTSTDYTTNLITNLTTSPITIMVTADLINNSNSNVQLSARQSLKIVPVIDGSSQIRDSTAVVTLSSNSANNYTLQASNLAYLEGRPNNSLYFYAFYIPTLNERNNLNRKSLFLGYTKISGSSLFPATGQLTFELPAVPLSNPSIPAYSPSNIRLVLSKKLYPINYFTNPLSNVGYNTYLIDDCVDDRVIYDIYCRGLNSTNTFLGSGFSLAVGTMDNILNSQIYVDKVRGFLQ